MSSESKVITVYQRVRWLPADMDTPISLFLGMAKGSGILLESAEVDGRWGRYSVLACDMALILACREGRLECMVEDERFASIAELSGMPFVEGLREAMRRIEVIPAPEAATLPPITRSLCGWLGHGMAGLFDHGLANALPPHQAEGMLCLPGTLMLFDHLYNRLVQVSLGEHRPVEGRHSALDEVQDSCPAEGSEVQSSLEEEEYREIVRQIKEKLVEGEAIQAVPSVLFSEPFEGDALTLYRRMRSASPSPYMFFMRLPGITLFGSSPEVMVQCSGGKLFIAPIAGSRRRGRSVAEDAALAEALLADPQESAKHMMLVDLGRSDLGRIAAPASVEVESLMAVERFSQVMHLTSRITARLREGLDAVDVLASAFPAGAVSGVPRRRAVEMVAEFGQAPRGPYAGCIGWIGLDKGSVHLDTGIAVRTLWVRDGRLFWQAGAAVSHDTDEALAWKNIAQKSAMIRQSCSESEGHHVPAHR